jgi:TonB-linked SusC/RagA family outer membrane protein
MKKKWFFTDYRYLFACVGKILKVMRLSIFLIALLSFQSFALDNYAQSKKIDLKITEASISQVLERIENQSEFFFFYNNKAVSLDQKVSLNVKDKTITELLDVLFKNTNVEYTINNRQIILSNRESNSSAVQQKKITGKVTNSNGEVVPGLAVAVKGTTNGTVTDINGDYSILDVPADATLVFSFIGMKTQEIKLSGKSVVNVTMEEETIGLDEVVAIGYGTVKKQDLTGSVAIMKPEALTQRGIANVGEAFAGQMAGVQAQQTTGKPGAELTIKIRGLGTINASNNPLYVIDGVPCGDNMKDINPNDIASIEVLKDASSSAIYGARGSSGVVLITTKQGGKSKPTFDFVMSHGVQQVDKIIDMMDIYEYTAFNIWARNESYVRSGGSMSVPNASRPAAYQYPENFNDPSSLPNTNWLKEVYRIAPMQSYQLTASGGNDAGSYLVSGSYMNQEGVVRESGYSRFNLRVNTTLNVGSRLKLGMNIAPSFSTENNPDSEGKESALHHAMNYSPNVPTNMNTEEWGYTPGGTAYANSLQRLKEVHDETRTNRVLANVWGELEIIKALKFKSQYGYNFRESRNSYFRPSNVNQGIASYGTFAANDQYDWSVQNTLNYAPKVSELFDVSVLVGQSAEGSKLYFSNGKSNGYPNSLVYTLNVASTAVTSSTSEFESAMLSYFGRVNFNVKDKYLLTMNLRRDGSSNFGKDTKWGWFPSASIGWKIDREEFLKGSSDWLDLLKLRLSIGKAGNNSIGYYSSISSLGVTNYSLNGAVANGLAPSTIANSNLGWESKTSKNIGLDLGVFKGRIQANLDYYIDDTKDMLQNVPVSYMTGYSTSLQNIGEVQNRGWEFELTTHNLEGKFKWTTSFNISKNTNEVKKLGNGDAPIIGASWGNTAYITKVGEAIASYYMYKTDGLLGDADFDAAGKAIVPIVAGQEKGNVKIVDVSKDGKIDANDRTILGNNLPDFIWGLNNHFSYRSFDLNVLLQGSQGGKLFFLGTRHMDNGAIGTNQFARWVNCYKPTRTSSTIPTNTTTDLSWDGKTPYPFGNNPAYNDTWLYDATFLRIKSVTLGYNLPKNLCSILHLGSGRIYIMGDNLFTWNNYPGSTPETNSYGTTTGNGTTSPGTDYATYPISRRYSVGINLTF